MVKVQFLPDAYRLPDFAWFVALLLALQAAWLCRVALAAEVADARQAALSRAGTWFAGLLILTIATSAPTLLGVPAEAWKWFEWLNAPAALLLAFVAWSTTGSHARGGLLAIAVATAALAALANLVASPDWVRAGSDAVLVVVALAATARVAQRAHADAGVRRVARDALLLPVGSALVGGAGLASFAVFLSRAGTREPLVGEYHPERAIVAIAMAIVAAALTWRAWRGVTQSLLPGTPNHGARSFATTHGLIIASGLVLAFLVGQATERWMRVQFIALARIAATAMEPGDAAHLASAGPASDPVLVARVERQLRALASAHQDILFTYVWTIVGNEFVLPLSIDARSAADETPFDNFRSRATSWDRERDLAQEPFTSGPLDDGYGVVMTVNAPLRREPGAPSGGWLGLDVPAARWFAIVVRNRMLALAIAGAASIAFTGIRLQSLRRKRDEELQRRSENEARTVEAEAQFIALASHELRTPLQVISGRLQELQNSSLPLRAAKAISVMEREADAMKRLVTDLLEWKSADAHDMARAHTIVPLRTWLADEETRITAEAARKGLTFRVAIDEALPAMAALDRARLQQVVRNLLENAVRYTERGWVELRVSFLAESGNPPPDGATWWLYLDVLDTGPGIPANMREQVFLPFVRTSPNGRIRGFGLGLTVVQRLVQRMKGDVQLREAPGGGAWFRVRVPAWTAAGDPAPDLPAPPCVHVADDAVARPASLHGTRFLIAEDHQGIREWCVDALRRLGATVEGASNATDASVCLARHSFDVVVIDAHFEGADGLHLIGQVRPGDETHTPRVIVMSATHAPELRARALAAGATAFVEKPFSLETLLAAAGLHAPTPQEAFRAQLARELTTAREEYMARNIMAGATRVHLLANECLATGHEELIDRILALEDAIRADERELIAQLFDELAPAAARSRTF